MGEEEGGNHVSESTHSCKRLSKACAKLTVLKDSALGIFQTRQHPLNMEWFEGASAILEEATGVMEKTCKGQSLADQEDY